MVRVCFGIGWGWFGFGLASGLHGFCFGWAWVWLCLGWRWIWLVLVWIWVSRQSWPSQGRLLSQSQVGDLEFFCKCFKLFVSRHEQTDKSHWWMDQSEFVPFFSSPGGQGQTRAQSYQSTVIYGDPAPAHVRYCRPRRYQSIPIHNDLTPAHMRYSRPRSYQSIAMYSNCYLQ